MDTPFMHDVEAITRGGLRPGPGTLYRSLQRMHVDGLVERAEEDEPDPAAGGRAERRRSYRITPAGRQAADHDARGLKLAVDAARTRDLIGAKTATTALKK